MSSGEVIPPNSESYARGVELLFGSPEAVENLRNKTQEPALWAAAEFAGQCLLAPEQVPFQDHDPQLFQIGTVLKAKNAAQQEIVVLDCGAGKGRLARWLGEWKRQNTSAALEYIPIEPLDEHDELINQASESFLSPTGILRDVTDLPGDQLGKVDVAVLCNVLHEVRPDRWPHLLNQLVACLTPSGSLIICEDSMMPKGEIPNDIGFLVLGLQEFKILFGLPSPPRAITHRDENYKERLLCVEIPKNAQCVTADSVIGAIEYLELRMTNLVKGIRAQRGAASGRDGRLYGLYSQMLINCRFALEELRTNGAS